ncbi:putative secreted RxLR effector protein [Phytophthora cinnamomi]|uniref:putative secreted RxLR effector protein n=1 Tax=Phytophthora cinnamomi TaxID=4785 RepID=UPI00355A8ED8|nr:putative secreted RxLR effector protein [Phytophthora cinnamomi]
MNLYAFLLLTATTTTFLVSGEALAAAQTTISRVQSPGPLRVVVSPSDEKRSLRASGISRSKMLEDEVYRNEIFQTWLGKNHSSMYAYDFFMLDQHKKYEKYRDLYDEYAKLHKESGRYP